MKWFNTETRAISGGDYYRQGDWSVDMPEDWEPPRNNFTNVPPPDVCLRKADPIPCDWNSDTQSWDVAYDEAEDILSNEFYEYVDTKMEELFPRNERERLAAALSDPNVSEETKTKIRELTAWSDSCWDLYYQLKPQVLNGESVNFEPDPMPHIFLNLMQEIRS